MLKYFTSVLLLWLIYIIWRMWPVLWALMSRNTVVRVQRVLDISGKFYQSGRSGRAADIAGWGLHFAGSPEVAKTPEERRLGSDLAALSALAYGRMSNFLIAQMMARNSVIRDETNPFAYEALGLALFSNDDLDGARVSFQKGLNVARESQPPDVIGEDRINGQILSLFQ